MNHPSQRPEDLIPLTPTAFQIILLLLEDERHGYAIVKELTRRKPVGLSLFPASLYRVLRRMEGDGLIESRRRTAASGKTRTYFRVTDLGRSTARLEAKRLDDLVVAARSVRLLGASEHGKSATP